MTYRMLALIFTAFLSSAGSAATTAARVAECAYALANVKLDPIDPTEFQDAEAGRGLFAFWASPDQEMRNNRLFVFLPNGRLAITRTLINPNLRAGSRMFTRVVTLDPDGTVRKQTAPYRRDSTLVVPTEHWAIDVNRAHLILGFALYHARANDPRLIEAFDMLKLELAPGALD